MRCLSDEQIEQLAATKSGDAPEMAARHVESCASCRDRLSRARDDVALVVDILELESRRRDVQGLIGNVENRLSSR